MASNTITIALSQQDRDLLQALREALLGAVQKEPEAPKAEESKLVEPVETKEETPEEFEQLTIPHVFEEPEPPKYTTADVRGKVTKLIAAGKKAQARDIVKSYADCIDNLPEDKLPEIMEKLTAAEEG